eukprot:1005015-Pleurochrysis_carterae.AAC.2
MCSVVLRCVVLFFSRPCSDRFVLCATGGHRRGAGGGAQGTTRAAGTRPAVAHVLLSAAANERSGGYVKSSWRLTYLGVRSAHG